MHNGWKSIFLSTIIVVGLIITNFIIQVGVNPSYNNMSTDSGTFAYCGQVINNGGLMYRDCWDNKPPGVYYLNAAAIRLGGSTPYAIWLFQAIWLTAAIVLFFFTMKHIWGNTWLATLGAFTLLLLILYPDIFQGGNFTETYAVLPVVLSLGSFWAYLRSGRRLWLVAIGLLFAASFLLKPTYIAAGIAAGIIVILLGLKCISLKKVATNLAIFCLSAFIPLFLVGLYWFIKKDFTELWFAVFIHNFTYLQQGFSITSLYGTARMFLVQEPMAALSILVGSSLGVFLFEHWQEIFAYTFHKHNANELFIPGHLDDTQAKVWFMAGIFLSIVFDIAFLASSGKNFGHYLQVLLPSLVTAMLYMLNFLQRSFQTNRFNRSLAVMILSVVLMVIITGGLEIAGKEIPGIQNIKSFLSTPYLTQYQPNELEQYIIDHSSPSDSVLIWAGHPSMNFVTQRRSPTRYIFLLHLFTPTAKGSNGFNEFLGELNADEPKLIVVQPQSSMGLPYFENSGTSLCPNCDPLTMQGMQAFKEFINSNYSLIFTIWDWEVYQHIQ